MTRESREFKNNSNEHLFDILDGYKDAYHRWLNKQGAPSIYFRDKIVESLNDLENGSADVRETIERERKLNQDFDCTTDNPLVSELWETEEVIEYLLAILFDVNRAIDNAPPQTAPDTQAPERKTDAKLPPVIQAVLGEGFLDTPLVNGKYLKKGDNKDTQIIEWIFDYSGYGDSLTAELYMQYIQTNCKATTIQDYITRKKKSPD
jgi:hypothetical protein